MQGLHLRLEQSPLQLLEFCHLKEPISDWDHAKTPALLVLAVSLHIVCATSLGCHPLITGTGMQKENHVVLDHF